MYELRMKKYDIDWRWSIRSGEEGMPEPVTGNSDLLCSIGVAPGHLLGRTEKNLHEVERTWGRKLRLDS